MANKHRKCSAPSDTMEIQIRAMSRYPVRAATVSKADSYKYRQRCTATVKSHFGLADVSIGSAYQCYAFFLYD